MTKPLDPQIKINRKADREIAQRNRIFKAANSAGKRARFPAELENVF